MGFKVIDFSRKSTRYVYVIKGEKPWGILDIVPHMLAVSKKSRAYALLYSSEANFSIIDKRGGNRKLGKLRRAYITLEKTLFPEINKLKVSDAGRIGKQMIDKFIRAVENSENS